MAEIRRLTDSCVLVTDDFGAITMFDPGFHTFESCEIDPVKRFRVHCMGCNSRPRNQ